MAWTTQERLEILTEIQNDLRRDFQHRRNTIQIYSDASPIIDRAMALLAEDIELAFRRVRRTLD